MKHWVNENIWKDWPKVDKDFGRWHNKNSMRVVQFSKYRGPDDFDLYMLEHHYDKRPDWWNKWYLDMWGGGRPDKVLLFKTKKEAMVKLKKILSQSDMKYKL
jgi:hypothetical protein